MRSGFMMAAAAGAVWAIFVRAPALGQTTTPSATVPAKPTTAKIATAPTSAPIDPSTPKGALKVLTRALDTGDRKMLLEVLHADTPVERKIAEATAGLAEATAELRRAATKAFGEQASRPLGVDPDAVPQAMARVDSSSVSIVGDQATVTSPEDQNDTLLLVQRDAKWHVPMSQIAGPAVEAADVDKSLRDSAEHAKLLKELAGEVAAGKYKSAAEARQELDKRIMKLTMPLGAAATAPAPAPKPAPAEKK